MKYSVKWSLEAQVSFEERLQFLLSRWTTREVNSFIDRTETVIDFLTKHPRIITIILLSLFVQVSEIL
jgi:plasmid stabilization system protein ParE